MNKCLQCGKEIEQTIGKKARLFCNDACRKKYSRSNADKIEQSNTDISNTDTSENQIRTIEKERYILDSNGKIQTANNGFKVRIGFCHGCGEDFTTIKGLTNNGTYFNQKMADMHCICSHCLKKGISHESLGLEMCK